MHPANKQNKKYIASFLHLLPKPIYLHSRKKQVLYKCWQYFLPFSVISSRVHYLFFWHFFFFFCFNSSFNIRSMAMSVIQPPWSYSPKPKLFDPVSLQSTQKYSPFKLPKVRYLQMWILTCLGFLFENSRLRGEVTVFLTAEVACG